MLLSLALCLAAAAPPAQTGVPEAARPRYLEAVAKLGEKNYSAANDVLNALAADHPRVAEIFASRCSAQLGLQHWAAAEADCAYTLRLKPLPTAIYGLAVAEDGQGKLAAAVTHYRQYAALVEALPALKQQALSRAGLLDAQLGAVAPAPPAPVLAKVEPVVAHAPPPPGGGKGQFVPGIPDPNEGLLYVYRNLLMGIGTPVTLYVDGKRVGELWNDHYFEVRLKPGAHRVTIKAATSAGQRAPEHTLTLDLVETTVNYLKLEYAPQGEDAAFKLISVGKEGRKEIREDCELAYAKKL